VSAASKPSSPEVSKPASPEPAPIKEELSMQELVEPEPTSPGCPIAAVFQACA
jgi:hypothetical protein